MPRMRKRKPSSRLRHRRNRLRRLRTSPLRTNDGQRTRMASIHPRRKSLQKPCRCPNILLRSRQRLIHSHQPSRPRRIRQKTPPIHPPPNVATQKMANPLTRPLIHRPKPRPSHGRTRPPKRQSLHSTTNQRKSRRRLPQSPRQRPSQRQINRRHRCSSTCTQHAVEAEHHEHCVKSLKPA